MKYIKAKCLAGYLHRVNCLHEVLMDKTLTNIVARKYRMHNHNPLPSTKKRQLLHVGMLITRPQLMYDIVRT